MAKHTTVPGSISSSDAQRLVSAGRSHGSNLSRQALALFCWAFIVLAIFLLLLTPIWPVRLQAATTGVVHSANTTYTPAPASIPPEPATHLFSIPGGASGISMWADQVNL